MNNKPQGVWLRKGKPFAARDFSAPQPPASIDDIRYVAMPLDWLSRLIDAGWTDAEIGGAIQDLARKWRWERDKMPGKGNDDE